MKKKKKVENKNKIIYALSLVLLLTLYGAVHIFSEAGGSSGLQFMEYGSKEALSFVFSSLLLLALFLAAGFYKKNESVGGFSLLIYPAFTAALGAVRVMPQSLTKIAPSDSSFIFISLIFVSALFLSALFKSAVPSLFGVICTGIFFPAAAMAFSFTLCAFSLYTALLKREQKRKNAKTELIISALTLLAALGFSAAALVKSTQVRLNFTANCLIFIPLVLLNGGFWIHSAIKKSACDSRRIMYIIFSLLPLFPFAAYSFSGAFYLPRTAGFAAVLSCTLLLPCLNLTEPEGETDSLIRRFSENPLLYIALLAAVAKAGAFMFARLGVFRQF